MDDEHEHTHGGWLRIETELVSDPADPPGSRRG